MMHYSEAAVGRDMKVQEVILRGRGSSSIGVAASWWSRNVAKAATARRNGPRRRRRW